MKPFVFALAVSASVGGMATLAEAGIGPAPGLYNVTGGSMGIVDPKTGDAPTQICILPESLSSGVGNYQQVSYRGNAQPNYGGTVYFNAPDKKDNTVRVFGGGAPVSPPPASKIIWNSDFGLFTMKDPKHGTNGTWSRWDNVAHNLQDYAYFNLSLTFVRNTPSCPAK
jgi:hypothetical protein